MFAAGLASADTSPAELPLERVNFGAGESVIMRAKPRETSAWVIEGNLASQFEQLASRARAGDAELAENLYVALSACEKAPRTDDELDRAIVRLRNERKLVQADGVTVEVEGSTDIESLVSVFLVDPYQLCQGLTEHQRGSAQEWLDLAVNLGNADAAIAALQTERDPYEQQRLISIVWLSGEPQVLGARAVFHANRAKSADGKDDDLVQAYANQYALNEIAKFFARHYPPLPIRSRLHASIARELERMGGELTSEDRNAAIKLAAEIVRANPNCCDVL